jgi:N utilization substance protein A
MFNSRELMAIIDAVSKEKGLSREEVLSYMEDAMETSLRKEFPETAKIEITIDAPTGDIFGNRLYKLVDSIEDVESQMLFNEVENEMVIDGFVYEPFHVNLNRQQINITKQVVFQKINNEARNKQFKSLLNRNILLFTGVVKVTRKEQLIVDYNGLDITIPRSHLLPRENFKTGDKVRFTIIEDRNHHIGSRTDPQFLIHLLKEEVDALYDGKIEIVKCIRSPGFRARLIVKSNSADINPIRLMVGAKGAHTNAVKNQLNGENITIIEYKENIADMLVEALKPVEIFNIVIDENTKKLEASVASENVASIIGKQGKNIASLSELLGWNVDIYSVDEWEDRDNKNKHALRRHFMLALSCDEELADSIIEAGLTSIEFFRVMSKEHLLDSLELDEDTVSDLINNANLTFEDPKELKKAFAYLELGELGFADDDVDTLVNGNIFSTQDVADLATDELVEILPNLEAENAGKFIMSARHEIEKAETEEV